MRLGKPKTLQNSQMSVGIVFGYLMVKMGQNKNRKLCLQIHASLNFNNFMTLLCQLQRQIAFLDFDMKIMKFSECFGNNQSCC